MAITENKFTSDELKAAIEANPDLLNIVVPVLTEKKYVVRDEATEATFRANLETQISTDLTRKHAETVEKDVLEITGIPKQQNEKYYDYLRRAATEKLQSVTKLEKELTDLKSKSNPSEADKARIQQLEEGVNKMKKEHQEAIEKKDVELKTFRTLAPIETAIAALRAKYKKDLPASVLTVMENTVKNDLLKIAEVDEKGNIYFKDAEGKPLIRQSDMGKLTPEEVVNERMKDVIDTGIQQPGGGSGPAGGGAGGNGNSGGKVVFTSFPSDVKTKDQATDYLVRIGLTHGSEEFDKAFETAKDLPLR
jgi:hypothetical protein